MDVAFLTGNYLISRLAKSLMPIPIKIKKYTIASPVVKFKDMKMMGFLGSNCVKIYGSMNLIKSN